MNSFTRGFSDAEDVTLIVISCSEECTYSKPFVQILDDKSWGRRLNDREKLRTTRGLRELKLMTRKEPRFGLVIEKMSGGGSYKRSE